MKKTKIVFIGSGAVGMSTLFSAMHQNLAAEYGIIDINKKLAKGNVMDFRDSIPAYREGLNLVECDYSDLKDADFVVVSAGAPQEPGQDREALININQKIIESIAIDVKNSGFNGISIIICNPVDALTYYYYKATGFKKSKVIGSGTILDTNRLRLFISEKINVSPLNIQAYVLGEHGNSSLVAFSSIKVGGLLLSKFKTPYTLENYDKTLEHVVRRRAYEIIDNKRSTYYGIGVAIAQIIRAIVRDSHEIVVCGTYIDGEYGYHDLVFGTPCVLGINGIEQVLEVELNTVEKAKLHETVRILKGHLKQKL